MLVLVKDIKFIIVCIIYLSCFFLESFIPLILNFFLLYKGFSKNYINSFIFLIIFLLISIFDFHNGKNFLIFVFSLMLVSSEFSNDAKKYSLIFSYIFSLFLLYIVFSSNLLYGDWQSVLLFENRLWLITGLNYEFNPNPLGFVAALCFIGFFINKKYISLIPVLIILILTQSRAAILFLIVFLTIYNQLKLSYILYISIFISIFYLTFKDTSFINRFIKDGENGRYERTDIYINYIKENFLIGIPQKKYQEMYDLYGTLDNLYLSSILNYGVLGLFLLFYLIFIYLRNYKDELFYFRTGIFVAMYIYGVFEAGFISNYFSWILFAFSFNNFSDRIFFKR